MSGSGSPRSACRSSSSQPASRSQSPSRAGGSVSLGTTTSRRGTAPRVVAAVATAVLAVLCPLFAVVHHRKTDNSTARAAPAVRPLTAGAVAHDLGDDEVSDRPGPLGDDDGRAGNDVLDVA